MEPMIRVGCWLGRVVIDCTVCGWQDPAPDSTTGQEARPLVELIDLAQQHVREAHGERASEPSRAAKFIDAVQDELGTSVATKVALIVQELGFFPERGGPGTPADLSFLSPQAAPGPSLPDPSLSATSSPIVTDGA